MILGGTLINHQTILTAGHCIYREFTYDFEGKTYTIPVEPNEYFKTWESMFVVYLGAHDIENNLPDINSTISKIIIVKMILTKNFYILLLITHF